MDERPTDEIYEELRPLLFSIAYRMVGSVGEAEDIVQEAFLRYHRAQSEGEEIDSPKAFLSTVTTRLSIDYLRSARAQREEYVGEWLPEPLLTDPDADTAQHAETADSLSLAFLVLLESLIAGRAGGLPAPRRLRLRLRPGLRRRRQERGQHPPARGARAAPRGRPAAEVRGLARGAGAARRPLLRRSRGRRHRRPRRAAGPRRRRLRRRRPEGPGLAPADLRPRQRLPTPARPRQPVDRRSAPRSAARRSTGSRARCSSTARDGSSPSSRSTSPTGPCRRSARSPTRRSSHTSGRSRTCARSCARSTTR